MRSTRCNNSDLLLINNISTCFRHLYAHRQEIQLRSTAYSCLSCCSCCEAGESVSKMCALCGECCLTGNILHTVHTSCHPTLQHHNSYNRMLPDRQHYPHSAHILPPDSPASQQLQQDRQL